MKPLQFDMTPLAKALEMPASPTNNGTDAVAEPKRAATPAREHAVPFPRHLSAESGWLSVLAQEQIHALATHVIARHTERGMRTLAVTSSLAGEGKTTVSLALAEKVASSGRRVLVVDLDTHRGTLSREAELEDRPGAIEMTSSDGSGMKSSPLHCYATDCRGVSIMPTGRVDYDEGGIPLLDPGRVSGLVQRALEEFDFVVLDCPPLLPVADTHIIGDIADSAILVVRANSTPRPVLDRALEDFGKHKFFAAVLNRALPHNIPYFREVYGYYRRPSNR